MSEVNVTTVTSQHMELAKQIVATLREDMSAHDALIVMCCACVVIASRTNAPADAIDHAMAIMSQAAPNHRGPLAKAVLDVLAESMEPSSV